MDEILAEMLKRKSYLNIGIGAGTGFYNFKTASAVQPGSEKKLLISPAISYLHKSGLSLSANAFIINDTRNWNVYQYAITPSYDYIKRRKFSTGFAFTRFFTKKDLNFYTTPIQNEAYGYFNYKKPWLQPGVAIAYGWGNRTELEERRVQLTRIRRKRNPTLITIRSDETVRDFSTLFSLRHDFSWNKLISKSDLFTLTPVVLVSAGTQHFGFNTSFQTKSKTAANFLPNNQYVQDRSAFDTQSATFILRGDYSSGSFYLQSQVLLDYYLHNADKRLNNAVSLIGGIIF